MVLWLLVGRYCVAEVGGEGSEGEEGVMQVVDEAEACP